MLYIASLYHANVYINIIHHVPTIYANKYTVYHFANALTHITYVLKLQFKMYVVMSNNVTYIHTYICVCVSNNLLPFFFLT